MLYICGIESKTLNSMKAYKGFNKDLTCRGFQYEEGKTYEHDGEVKLCNEGFHACEDPLETLDYYDVATSEYHEVELDGVSEERVDDSRVVAKKITIGARLGIDKLVKACIDFRFARIEKMLPNTGYKGAASNTGDKGAASNTGDNGAASNTGYKGAASNTGNYGAASNTGYKGAASNTGDKGAASNTGDKGAASNTGNYGAASNTGYKGAASNTGNYGAASNTGNYGAAETLGKHSIAMSVGKNSKARGALGTWIVLAERGEWDGVGYPIKDIQAFRVDGEKVKADTWYMLMNGQLEECE
jgi:hypothetical protein